MKTANQSIEIKTIANRLARGVNRWNQNGSALVSRLLKAVELELDCISFENDSARSMMQTVILRTFATNNKTSYKIVYPPCFMDENGNYTTNPKLWA